MALPKPGKKTNFSKSLEKEKVAVSQKSQNGNSFSLFDPSLEPLLSKLCVKKGDSKKGFQFEFEEYTRVALLPMQIKEDSPLVRDQILDAGSFWYYAPYFQHQLEYINEKGSVSRIPLICKQKTFGTNCIICNDRNSQVQNLVKEGTTYRDAYKAVGMDIKTRAIFLLYIYNGPLAGKVVAYDTHNSDGGTFSSLRKKITNSINLFVHREGLSVDSIDLTLVEESENVVGLDFDFMLELSSFGGSQFVQIGNIDATRRRKGLPDVAITAADEFGDFYSKIKIPNDDTVNLFLSTGVFPKDGFYSPVEKPAEDAPKATSIPAATPESIPCDNEDDEDDIPF